MLAHPGDTCAEENRKLIPGQQLRFGCIYEHVGSVFFHVTRANFVEETPAAIGPVYLISMSKEAINPH